MSENPAYIELKEKIDALLIFDKEALIHKSEWGSITLEAARHDYNRIFSIIEYLKVLPFEVLPQAAMNSIKTEINNVNGLFGRIVQFTIERENPANQRDTFINEIKSRADSLYTQAAAWIPFLAYQKGDVAKNIESLTEAVRDSHELLLTTKQEISNKEKEIQDIIKAAREASASAGAAVFTEDFKNESEALKEVAYGWLKVTTFFVMLSIIVASLMLIFPPIGLQDKAFYHTIGSKFFILVVLVTTTVWCGKIYKALMHQATINRHRALSIQTLNAFSAATEDSGIRDSIVHEAAKSVFSNVSTGYIDAPSQSGESDIKVFEIIKAVLPKK